MAAVGPGALAQRPQEVRVGPAADAGLDIAGYVRSAEDAERGLEPAPAGELGPAAGGVGMASLRSRRRAKTYSPRATSASPAGAAAAAATSANAASAMNAPRITPQRSSFRRWRRPVRS